ncbi:phosphate/phosphite/phosphonate ABC transporter substrate-binding protein [Microbacterium sp.]|uniref:phosphate/phosphite/phosphonate ABC transporter substrate-binding protein n=1 Tax=Microbacterium sp. TaxID=51671 RepID=UPI003C784942
MQSSPARPLALATGIALLLSLAACSSTPPSGTAGTAADAGTFASGDENTLVFAVLPDREGADQDNQPIADWISGETGKEVRFFEATDYAAVVQGLAAGQIDIAQISGFTYYQAQNAGAQIEPIGALISQEGGEPGYHSVAIKNPASDASTLSDFADQRVCFVSPASTSGFAVPTGSLLEAGVTVDETNRVFGEKHDLTVAQVAEGFECQVGFAQDADADPMIATGAVEEVTRVRVPGEPIVMQSALPQDLKDELTALLADSTPQDLVDAGFELNEYLAENWFGYGKVDDSYYDLIRTLCDEVADQVTACRA